MYKSGSPLFMFVLKPERYYTEIRNNRNALNLSITIIIVPKDDGVEIGSEDARRRQTLTC